MKKRNLFFALAAGAVVFSACSNNEDILVQGDNNENAAQQIVLQVASAGDGLQTRAGRPLLSSEAKQNIENVKLIICGKDDKKVKFVKEITDWNTNGSTTYTQGGHGRETVVNFSTDEKLEAGIYTVYAFGYSNNSEYNLDVIKNAAKDNTFNENTTLTFTAGADSENVGEEIFAGSLELTVEAGKGFKTPVVLNRQVAGTFAYVKDLPYFKDAAKLRLMASNPNTQLVLGNFANIDLTGNGKDNTANVKYVVNGTQAASDKVIYEIALTDWFNAVEDKDGDNLIDAGQNWKGDKDKYAEGSVFAGQFIIPFQKVDNNNTFELQLTKNDDTVLRTWIIKLPSAQISNSLTAWNGTAFAEVANYSETVKAYSVVRNHLYGIGQRALDVPTDPGNPDTGNPDKPESLNNKQELVLRVNDNWDVIHDMEIE